MNAFEQEMTEDEIKHELLMVWHAMMASNDVLGSRLGKVQEAMSWSEEQVTMQMITPKR